MLFGRQQQKGFLIVIGDKVRIIFRISLTFKRLGASLTSNIHSILQYTSKDDYVVSTQKWNTMELSHQIPPLMFFEHDFNFYRGYAA